MPKSIRKIRHWKQRYHPDAAFICRRRIQWGGRAYESGEPIPGGLAANKGKLRRFWEGGWIELAEFEVSRAGTGRIETNLPNGASLELRGSWYIVTLSDGSEYKAQGRVAYGELLAEISG